MRTIYQDLLKRELQAGRLTWLGRAALRYPLLWLSRRWGRPLCGPILGTLLTTYRCNLRCEMCDLPQWVGERPELSTGHMLALVDAFARLGALGIGLTGGEPLLRTDVFDVIRRIKARGMIAHLNTNGMLVDRTAAADIVACGVDSVNVSLDGMTAATHDRIRGVEGAFAGALGAMEYLVAERRAAGRGPRLKFVAVAGAANLVELTELPRFAAGLGADCVEVIPRQAFTPGGEAEPMSADAVAAAAALVARWEQCRGGRVAIENSPGMLRLIPQALSGGASPLACYAGYHSLVVDCCGDVYPCLPWLNSRRRAANLADGSLPALWRGPRYAEVRREVAACRSCTLNCHAELNLLFNRRP